MREILLQLRMRDSPRQLIRRQVAPQRLRRRRRLQTPRQTDLLLALMRNRASMFSSALRCRSGIDATVRQTGEFDEVACAAVVACREHNLSFAWFDVVSEVLMVARGAGAEGCVARVVRRLRRLAAHHRRRAGVVVACMRHRGCGGRGGRHGYVRYRRG